MRCNMNINNIKLYGDQASENVIIQMVDDHDLEVMETEAAEAARLAGGDFCIAAVPVDDWNRDLSPWEADPVFGKERFGSGAADTLKFITDSVLPWIEREHPFHSRKAADDPASAARRYYIAGYSLAGLFALCASYQTDIFCGTAAASPSVWFPGWIEYSAEHHIKVSAVYLSLGDKELRIKNALMKTVGDCIIKQEEILSAAGIDTILEWNKGNHFQHSDLRTAAGIAWLLR